MPTDTTVNNLVINKLTKAQYDGIQTKSDTELYLVPDEVDSVPTSNSTNLVTSGGTYAALSLKENASNKVTSISSSSTNTQYPTAKAVYDFVISMMSGQ